MQCFACLLCVSAERAQWTRPPTVTRQKRSTAAEGSSKPLRAKNSEDNERNRSFRPNNHLNSNSPHAPLHHAWSRAISPAGPQFGGHQDPGGRPTNPRLKWLHYISQINTVSMPAVA
uniref:Uncharacterized protein n=1 Tax=Eutreptiella gymnastica TaxID=73025 RepID=A0A7S4G541_9EUGL